MTTLCARLWLSVLLAASVVSCDGPEAPGDLEVRWRTGRLSCSAAGVGSVRAELFDFHQTESSVTEVTACEQRVLVLEEVSAGEYTLVLKGLDSDGCWTHEARRDDVVVPAGGTEVVEELALLRRERPLRVRWPFVNELDCEGNGVEQVEITVDVEDRASESFIFRCPGLSKDITGIPAGDASVQVVALDGNGTPLAQGTASVRSEKFRDAPCEEVIEVRIPLELCAEAGC